MGNRTSMSRRLVALVLAFTLAAPVAVLASDGKKHFRDGLKYEENRQWDKAAEQFALAVAEKPSNVEYTLHLQRALVSAGLMLVERGDSLAAKKDFAAAYTAYRQAYAFDPTNELALIKMRRALEAQGLPTDNIPSGGDPMGPSTKPKNTDPTSKASYIGTKFNNPTQVILPAIPGRKFPKQDVIYRDLPVQQIIEQLAQVMKLNVMFDTQTALQVKNQKTSVELRDVTYPHAFEMILKTNNLMYAQLDSRTVVVSGDNPQSRTKYEPYAVRTFYIKNADVEQVRGAIQSTLTQTKNLNVVKQLNAIIVRDTPSNLDLIDNMINSLDKSKAEVLIDVSIYEVDRTDLVSIGNQFVAETDSTKLGLSGFGGFGQNQNVNDLARAHTFIGSLAGVTPLGFALGMPASTMSFFQNKGKAKLLASTQVHVLDAEQNTVRLGQRVPIQTASLPTFTGVTAGQQRASNQQAGLNPGDFSGGVGGAFLGGIPQIQYENVGLNLDLQPNVYENEVQMKMKIEATSLDTSTGKFTPSFNQRTMTSVARVKDGQTTLVAGVSQNQESKSVKGMPIIGLIPILGRFFATPETDNKQTDVVITVTPHILRRADIREDDHLARAAGDFNSSSNQLKIDQILYLADLEDQQQSPIASNDSAASTPASETKPPPLAAPPQTVSRTEAPGVVVVSAPPVTPSEVRQAAPQQASRPNVTRKVVDRPGAASKQPVLDDDDDDDDEPANQNPVTVTIRPASTVAVRGQDLYVAVYVSGQGEMSSAHVSVSFDPNILEVKGVRDSGVMSNGGATSQLQFTSDSGLLNVQMDRPAGAPGVPPRGQLLMVVFAVKAQGQSPLTLNEGQMFFRSSAGQVLRFKTQSSQIDAR
jgi:general secretion pathway protein D